MTVAFKDWVKACQQRVEKAAENNLPQEALIPQKLHSAMRYSVIGGGKRVRPLLVYAVGQIFDADPLSPGSTAKLLAEGTVNQSTTLNVVMDLSLIHI